MSTTKSTRDATGNAQRQEKNKKTRIKHQQPRPPRPKWLESSVSSILTLVSKSQRATPEMDGAGLRRPANDDSFWIRSISRSLSLPLSLSLSQSRQSVFSGRGITHHPNVGFRVFWGCFFSDGDGRWQKKEDILFLPWPPFPSPTPTPPNHGWASRPDPSPPHRRQPLRLVSRLPDSPSSFIHNFSV